MERHADRGTIAGATLRITRDLPGPIARVWRYLTEPDALVTWLGRATIPQRSGEDFVLRFVHEPGEPAADAATMHGTTTIVDAPHVLEYRWRESAGESIVRFDLRETADGAVRLVLTHRRLPVRHTSEIGGGWETHLDVLDAELRGSSRPDFFARYAAHEAAYARRPLEGPLPPA